MRFLGLDALSRGIRPPLLTMREYLRRAQLGDDAAAWFMSHQLQYGAKAKRDRDMREAKNVVGRSVLADLPYFDVPKHTLLDMMHDVQGLLGRIFLPLLKDRLDAYKNATGETTMKKPVEPLHYAAPRVGEKVARSKEWNAYKKASDRYRASVVKDCIALGERAYKHIQAPMNVAPPSKRPLTVSGDMTAYHWLNFTKVYGKYLIFIMFNRPLEAGHDERVKAMRAFRAVFHLMNLCLSSNVTASVKEETSKAVVMLSGLFDQLFPVMSQVINLHTLLFHIPATIRRWGPARGFWCFPFER
jgi:hypothetical protein